MPLRKKNNTKLASELKNLEHLPFPYWQKLVKAAVFLSTSKEFTGEHRTYFVRQLIIFLYFHNPYVFHQRY